MNKDENKSYSPSKLQQQIVSAFPREHLEPPIWSVRPNINEKELNAAVRSYGRNLLPTISTSDVLILKNEALWGPGSVGLFITKDGIGINTNYLYLGLDMETKLRPFWIPFSRLITVKKEEGGLIFRIRNFGNVRMIIGGKKEEKYLSSFILAVLDMYQQHQGEMFSVGKTLPASKRSDINQTNDDSADQPWLPRVLVQVGRARKQAGQLSPDEERTILAIIDVLGAQKKIQKESAPAAATGRFSICSILPLKLVQEFLLEFIPPNIADSWTEDSLIFEFKKSRDFSFTQARKWFAGVTLGSLVGGYWGAVAGAAMANSPTGQALDELSVQVGTQGSCEIVASSKPSTFADLLVHSVATLDMITALSYAMGLCSFPPDRIDSLPLPDKLTESLKQYVGDDEAMVIDTRLRGQNDKTQQACFVATVCYGDVNAPEVVTLRAYRDRHLCNYPQGRFLIQCYYLLSPWVSSLLIRHSILRRAIRIYIVTPLARMAASRIVRSYPCDIQSISRQKTFKQINGVDL
jgi:hypothetical protein